MRRVSMAVAVVVAAFVAVPAAPAAAAPPLNDAFLLAEPITGTDATVTGTIAEATKETGEPHHYDHIGGQSVWYSWTAPADGVLALSTAGTSFDPVVGVYTGLTVDGLTRVASNHGGTLRVPVKSGTTYRIAIDRCSGTGALKLGLKFTVAPANDNLAAASPLTGASATATGTNEGATTEPGEPRHEYDAHSSVWWTWTAPSTGGVTVSTAGSTFDTILAAYTGDTPSGLIRIASNDDAGTGRQSAITFRAIEGTTYRFAVAGAYYTPNVGSVALSLSLSPPPANDAFAAAVDLGNGATGTATGTNLGASTEPGEPSHYSYEAAESTVWYRWTAPKDGSLTLRADGSAARALAAYTGTSVSGLTRVPNQAQYAAPGPQQIRIRVQAGTTYRIALTGRVGAMGAFNLSLALVDRPVNDDFAAAIPVAGLTAQVQGTNVGATQEPGEPVHEENYYDPSVWYTWTAPATGGVTLDTAGSALDAVVAVYTGTSVGALTRVASWRAGQGGGTKRYFRAAAGVTYRIAVDGRSAQMDTFKLALSSSLPPANDLFAAAQPLAGDDATATGDTIGATGEDGEPSGTAGTSVWYQWTAPGSGRAKLTLPTNPEGLSVRAYTGTSPKALTAVPFADAYYDPSFATTAGTTYRILVDGGTTRRGPFGVRVQYTPAPANDDFAAASVLTGTSPTGTSNTTAATRETGEPSHAGYYGVRSVWWTWTAPEDGRATLDLAGTSFSWVAGVYTGDTVGALTRVTSGTRSDYRKVVWQATKGTTYRIAIDGRYSDYYGPVSLALSLVDPPKNDHFADATVLTGSADDVTGSSAGGSQEA